MKTQTDPRNERRKRRIMEKSLHMLDTAAFIGYLRLRPA
jgi:hypothetical protein